VTALRRNRRLPVNIFYPPAAHRGLAVDPGGRSCASRGPRTPRIGQALLNVRPPQPERTTRRPFSAISTITDAIRTRLVAEVVECRSHFWPFAHNLRMSYETLSTSTCPPETCPRRTLQTRPLEFSVTVPGPNTCCRTEVPPVPRSFSLPARNPTIELHAADKPTGHNISIRLSPGVSKNQYADRPQGFSFSFSPAAILCRVSPGRICDKISTNALERRVLWSGVDPPACRTYNRGPTIRGPFVYSLLASCDGLSISFFKRDAGSQ